MTDDPHIGCRKWINIPFGRERCDRPAVIVGLDSRPLCQRHFNMETKSIEKRRARALLPKSDAGRRRDMK